MNDIEAKKAAKLFIDLQLDIERELEPTYNGGANSRVHRFLTAYVLSAELLSKSENNQALTPQESAQLNYVLQTQKELEAEPEIGQHLPAVHGLISKYFQTVQKRS